MFALSAQATLQIEHLAPRYWVETRSGVGKDRGVLTLKRMPGGVMQIVKTGFAGKRPETDLYDATRWTMNQEWSFTAVYDAGRIRDSYTKHAVIAGLANPISAELVGFGLSPAAQQMAGKAGATKFLDLALKSMTNRSFAFKKELAPQNSLLVSLKTKFSPSKKLVEVAATFTMKSKRQPDTAKFVRLSSAPIQ